MSSKKAVFAVGCMLLIASMACTNPITSYLSTRTAVMQTATATMWTPTPTNTPTFTPTNTPDPRYYETDGPVDFSYVPPKGWKKDTGEDLMAWQGPGDTNLYFFSDELDYSAKEMVLLVTTYYESEYGAKCSNKGSFSTDEDLDAAWAVCTISASDGTIRIAEYMFTDDHGSFVEATYLRVDDEDEDQDDVVEDCLSTLRFD